MASPSTVLSLGFGSFGSVGLLPTLGFGAGVAAAATLTATLSPCHGPNSAYRNVAGPDSGYRECIGADNRMRTLTDE